MEDNLDNMVSLKAVLGGQYDILEAHDGRAGLSMAREQHPDLILLDLSLPSMDGFGVLRQLREEPAAKRIPVIALTAQAMKGDRERILAAGCDDYVAKPYDPQDLLAKIKLYLAGA